MGELLDALGVATRIEAGRYEPALVEADSLELVQAAAERLGEKAVASGSGAHGSGRPRSDGGADSRRSPCAPCATAASSGPRSPPPARRVEISPIPEAAAPIVLART